MRIGDSVGWFVCRGVGAVNYICIIVEVGSNIDVEVEIGNYEGFVLGVEDEVYSEGGISVDKYFKVVINVKFVGSVVWGGVGSGDGVEFEFLFEG